jgi:hypothetical protein
MSDKEERLTGNKTAKLDLRLTADVRESVEALTRRHGRSVAAEVRAALDAWIGMHGAAVWLDVGELRRRDPSERRTPPG